MAKLFKAMTRDERAEVVRQDMAAGGSYNGVAREHGVSKGVIAGICRDYRIPSTNTNKGPRMSKPNIEPPPAPEPAQEPSGRAYLTLPKYKTATSEATQCVARDERGMPCGLEREPNSLYCKLPEHQALAKKEKPPRRR
jgi:hypothetical protein